MAAVHTLYGTTVSKALERFMLLTLCKFASFKETERRRNFVAKVNEEEWPFLKLYYWFSLTTPNSKIQNLEANNILTVIQGEIT